MVSEVQPMLSTIETVHQSIKRLYSRNPGRYQQLYDKSDKFYKAVQSNEIDNIKTTFNEFLQEAEKHRGYSRYIRETPILKSMFYGLTVMTNMCRLLWKWEPWTKEAVLMDKKTTSSEKVLGIKGAIDKIIKIAEQNKAIEKQREINEQFNSFLGATTDYQAIKKIEKITKERLESRWLMKLDENPLTLTHEERRTRFEGKSFFVLYNEQLYFIHPLITEKPRLLFLKSENKRELLDLFKMETGTSKQSSVEQYSIIRNSVHPDSFNKTILSADDVVPIMVRSIEEKFEREVPNLSELKKINSCSSLWQFPKGNKIVFKESIEGVTYDSHQKYPVSVMTLDGLFLVSQSTTSSGLQIRELLNIDQLTNLNLESYDKWRATGHIPKKTGDLDAKKIDAAIHSTDPTLQVHHMEEFGLESNMMTHYSSAMWFVTNKLIENISRQNDEAPEVSEAPIPRVAAVDENKENKKLEDSRTLDFPRRLQQSFKGQMNLPRELEESADKRPGDGLQKPSLS